MPTRIRQINPAPEIEADSIVRRDLPTTLEEALADPPDLGPQAAEIVDVLRRATLLSKSQRGRLAEAAAWRWWPLTLPAGGASSGPRTTALIRARAAGRDRAIPWLERAVALAPGEADTRSLAVRAVANAALALLVRESIDGDAFDGLSGPWREVTHR
jgi:hypothetical protein